MDANTRIFAIDNFRSLADEAGMRADTAHWNSDDDLTAEWSARESACKGVVAALRERVPCAEIRGMVAAPAAPTTAPELVHAWQEVENLFEEVTAWRCVDWPA